MEGAGTFVGYFCGDHPYVSAYKGQEGSGASMYHPLSTCTMFSISIKVTTVTYVKV